MSRVTSTARTVLQDLVERRLWPVALLLVGAVLAVPVVMGGGGDAAQTAAAPSDSAAKAAMAGGEGAQVSIVESTPASRKRAGHERNPFVQPSAAPSAAAAGSTSTGTSSGETASAPSGGQGSSLPSAAGSSVGSGPTTLSQGADKGATGAGGVESQPTTPVEASTPATTEHPVEHKDPSDDVFRVNLRFGSGPGEMHTAKDVARLTPLPSADDPVFVFLGVMPDAKTVVLLLPAGASGEGEGKCRPKAGDCRLLEVRTDETEVVDVPTADGGERQFVVRVTGLKRSDAKTDARAAEAHQRASKAGQDLLREAAGADGTDAFDAYRYRPELGTLSRAARKPRAAGTGTRTVSRPGEVVVWRTRPAQKH
jgi:hypothetical protein